MIKPSYETLSWNSEPQNIEQEISNDEVWNRCAQSLFKNKNDRIHFITDPNATVAWSGSLTPEFQTDISFKTFMGRGSGESIQMEFAGQGFVVTQPCEETYFQKA